MRLTQSEGLKVVFQRSVLSGLLWRVGRLYNKSNSIPGVTISLMQLTRV